MGKRERYSALFKARVAIEAIKEKETLRELSERFNVSIMTISKWKGEFLESSIRVFENGQYATYDKEKEIDHFLQTIKQEHIYLNPADDGLELYFGIKDYISFYNYKRAHQGIGRIRPVEKYENVA